MVLVRSKGLNWISARGTIQLVPVLGSDLSVPSYGPGFLQEERRPPGCCSAPWLLSFGRPVR